MTMSPIFLVAASATTTRIDFDYPVHRKYPVNRT
jgi:hypothetical protein